MFDVMMSLRCLNGFRILSQRGLLDGLPLVVGITAPCVYQLP